MMAWGSHRDQVADAMIEAQNRPQELLSQESATSWNTTRLDAGQRHVIESGQARLATS